MIHFGKLLLLLGFLAACASDPSGGPATESVDPHREIDSLEKVMRAKDQLDKPLADTMINRYTAFAKEHPKDSMAAVYLRKAGDVYKAFENRDSSALEMYRQVVVDHSYHAEAPVALFNSALIYEKHGDRARASASYRKFIRDYPGHEWRVDAENLLEMLRDRDGDDLQQVKKWMQDEKNKAERPDQAKNKQ